ncbi:MAG TPA: plastocyanin/azurin family copper-binding protein [Thermoleophilaceae bacterium]
MKKIFVLLAACLALGLVAAGCGSDDNDSSSDSGGAAAPAQTDSSGGSGGAAAKGNTEVVMKDISFQPGTVTVAKGATVTWKNEDSANHDVTADDGSFKSGGAGDISGGGTFKHTFDKAGSFGYVCTVHPGMKGTVVVK